MNTLAQRAPLAKVIALYPVEDNRDYTTLDDDTRDSITARLLAAADGNRNKIPRSKLEEVCETTGASPRALQLWVKEARDNRAAGLPALPNRRRSRTSSIVITDDILKCLVGRSLQAAWDKAVTEGLIPKCHPNTFINALYAQKGYDLIQGLCHGARNLPEHWVYPSIGQPVDLLEWVSIDLFMPRVAVSDLPEELYDDIEEEKHKGPVWAAVRAAGTNVLLTWHLFPKHPNSQEILALLGQAFRGYTHAGVFIGGIPLRIVCDREALFLTRDLRAGVGQFGTDVDPTGSYSSWENGGHERMHGVIRTEALTGLAARTDGPLGRDGKLALAGATVTFAELDALLNRWAWSYVFERPQAILDGRTPFQAWRKRIEAGESVQTRTVKALADLALPLAAPIVKSKKGIWLGPESGTRHEPAHYMSRKLMMCPSRRVLVREWPDNRRIEAYNATTGEYIGSLHRDDANMPEQVRGDITGRRSSTRRTTEDFYAEALRKENIRSGEGSPKPEPVEDDPSSLPSDSGDDSGGSPSGNAAPGATEVGDTPAPSPTETGPPATAAQPGTAADTAEKPATPPRRRAAPSTTNTPAGTGTAPTSRERRVARFNEENR